MSTSGMDQRSDTNDSQERRDTTAPRLQYEALVEVGAGATGGFEAESVDVSLDGMRMRTAYMPQTGERLVCRFDGFGGEIVAEAEVIWCKAETRGGEFGIRFTNLDQAAFGLLDELCELPVPEQEPEPSAVSSDAAMPGSRVRLHIDGLGSPMRARVRETARGEVLIGSNLEFLRVGRGVQLEDVERSRRRMAHIEHVGVDVDPETNVPQLVVALTYEHAAASVDEPDLTTAPFMARAAPVATEQETTPEPTVIDNECEPTPSIGRVSMNLSQRPARVARRPRSAEADARPAHDEAVPASEPGIGADVEEVAPAGPSMQQRVGAMAAKLAPTIKSASDGARGAIGSLLATVRKKRQERKEQSKQARAPRRQTAPPPSGALRSDGRRGLIRDVNNRSEAEVVPEPVPEPKRDRKKAAFGAVLGVLAVLAIYFVSSHLSKDSSAGVDADPAVAAANDAPKTAALPPAAGASLPTANVPLFGATPLSTTEPVPVPPEPGSAQEAESADQGDASNSPGDEGNAANGAALDTEWGVGEVSDPTVLRLKMDGKIDGFHASETATGFTLTVPNRKSISSAAGFKRKDKRIDSVNVVNYPDRAEVSVMFKKDVPAFSANVSGKRLIIEIATSKKKKKKKKKKATKLSKKKKKKSKKKKKKKSKKKKR